MALKLHHIKYILLPVLAYVCILLFIFFGITPLILKYMYHGPFFSFTMPVIIFDYSVIQDQYVVMVICVCLFTISIVSAFITEIATYEKIDDNLNKKVCDVVFQWIPFVVKIIFMRSHILFCFVILIGDLIAYGLVIDKIVDNRAAHPIYKLSNLDADEGEDDDEQDHNEYLLDLKKEKRKQMRERHDLTESDKHPVFSLDGFHSHVGLFQIILVTFSFCLLIFSDVADGSFMNIGPPIVILEKTIETNIGYILIHVFLFLDRMLFMAMELTVDKWMKDDVLNVYSEPGFTDKTTYFLYIVRIFIKWIRLAVTISVIFSQFIFVFMYISADIVSIVIHHYNRHKTEAHKKSDVLFYSFLYAVESIGFISILCLEQVWEHNAFFNWFSTVNFFSNLVVKNDQLAYLLVFTGLYQMGATLMHDIGMTDIWNWLYYKHSESVKQYSKVTIKTVMVINRLNDFMGLVFMLQFLFGNVFFVLVNMAANMSISIAVLAYHLQLKKVKIEAENETNSMAIYMQLAYENMVNSNKNKKKKK